MGINSIQVQLDESITQEELLAELEKLNSDPACTGYIVQLPCRSTWTLRPCWRPSIPTRMPMVCTR
ncbi:hypothetical protein [Nesterenkonia pannonica]|uniref:tetrahydrofolate dehydrogenase/cyclohydrolase catalytic domain-containing protein n=1 Tax=Nesterenkonia pannonica TaxID=1548602 RepID=UPI0021640876|nr:tetrahydrofolate dehydrogenase/cyclohydrolase catalytic domain-containing protein [Nesterenkonia pannonica]